MTTAYAPTVDDLSEEIRTLRSEHEDEIRDLNTEFDKANKRANDRLATFLDAIERAHDDAGHADAFQWCSDPVCRVARDEIDDVEHVLASWA